MAVLIDEEYMRGTFQIHSKVGTGRITPYIAVASKRLERWVGAANYADTDLADELKLAEGLIVMHLMTLNLNTNIRTAGLVRTEVVEDNKVVTYLSPTETAQTASLYLEQAEEIVRSYIQESSLPGVPLVNEEIDPVEWPE